VTRPLNILALYEDYLLVIPFLADKIEGTCENLKK